jgi:hypothetical protein
MVVNPKKLSRIFQGRWATKAKGMATYARRPRCKTPWEEKTRKLEPTRRDQEVLEESKKTTGVYVRIETGFHFPSFGFFIRFTN